MRLGCEGTGEGSPVQVASRSPALAAAVARLGNAEGVRAGFAGRGKGPVVLRTPGLLIRGQAKVPVRVAKPRGGG